MTQTNALPRILRLVAVALLWVIAGPAHADPPTLAERLATETGAGYAAARSEALALGPEQFNALLQGLQRPEATATQRTIARALRARRDNPALAQEFGQQVDAVLASPKRTASVTYSHYDATRLLRPDHSTDFLCFEMALKDTHIPENLRWSSGILAYAEEQRYPELIDPYLALMQTEGFPPYAASFLLLDLHQQFPDPRTVGAIAAAYKQRRLAHPQEFKDSWMFATMANHVAMIGGDEARAALRDLVAFEQAQMTQHGWAPWDDVEARVRKEQAAAAKYRGEPSSRRRRGLSPLTAGQAAELNTAYEDAAAAYQRRVLWEELTKSLADADAALGP